MTDDTIPEYITDLIASDAALGAFKENQSKAASGAASSRAGDVYDLLAAMLDAPEPARMNTPMRASPVVTRLVTPVARWRAEEIAYLLGAQPRGNLAGKLVRWIGEPLCRLIGAFVSETDYQQLFHEETVQ